MLAITKYEPRKEPEDPQEAYIWRMWQIFIRCPKRDTRDESGVLDLGEIGPTKSDRGIDRATPYSPGRVRE